MCNILQGEVMFAQSGSPNVFMSAPEDESMRKHPTGLMLRSIFEAYSSYIEGERWPAQLTRALARVALDTWTGDIASTVQKTERGDRAVWVGSLLEVEGIAMIYLSIHRN